MVVAAMSTLDASHPDFNPRKARHTWRYVKMRKRFLAEHPLCAECERQGVVTPAQELDHIIPVEKAPELFWDVENLQGLCKRDHLEKTRAENRRPVSPAQRAWDERIARLAGIGP